MPDHTPSLARRGWQILAWCVGLVTLAAVLGLGWAGSSRYTPPRFRLNLEGRNPASVSSGQREALERVLREMFGTPDQPRFPREIGFRQELLAAAAGPPKSDELGGRWGLYRQHCAECHGISGDGAGPAAAALAPYPRDFRDGILKYTSTSGGGKATRPDLLRTLRRGLRGTAMPAFARLDEEALESLAEYVLYLAVRGETELYLIRAVLDEDEYPIDPAAVVREAVVPAWQSWQAAAGRAVSPPPRPSQNAEQLAESLRQGRELYGATKVQCSKCHGPDGRGDGEQSELFDDWNKRKRGLTPEQTRERARLFRLPPQPLRPRNFTTGIFHGGQQPDDLYLRIHVGIKGTPMPPAGPAPGNPGVLTPEQIWQVVEYVRSLGGH